MSRPSSTRSRLGPAAPGRPSPRWRASASTGQVGPAALLLPRPLGQMLTPSPRMLGAVFPGMRSRPQSAQSSPRLHLEGSEPRTQTCPVLPSCAAPAESPADPEWPHPRERSQAPRPGTGSCLLLSPHPHSSLECGRSCRPTCLGMPPPHPLASVLQASQNEERPIVTPRANGLPAPHPPSPQPLLRTPSSNQQLLSTDSVCTRSIKMARTGLGLQPGVCGSVWTPWGPQNPGIIPFLSASSALHCERHPPWGRPTASRLVPSACLNHTPHTGSLTPRPTLPLICQAPTASTKLRFWLAGRTLPRPACLPSRE